MPDRLFPRDPVYYHHGLGVFHVIFFIAFVALLVMLAIWLINGARHSHHLYPAAPIQQPPQLQEDAALKEARMRYARGELTRKQFLEISTDLGGAPAQGEAAPPPG